MAMSNHSQLKLSLLLRGLILLNYLFFNKSINSVIIKRTLDNKRGTHVQEY